MENRPPAAHRGFTLIGVLVALAVIGIGLLAVISVAAKSVQVSSSLQQRNFANWIAQNRIARLRLAADWPDVGTSDGSVTFANRKWKYTTEVAETPDKDLRRVTVSVALASDPDTIVTRLVGFLGEPPAHPATLPSPWDSGKAKPPKPEPLR
ncbi:MAG: type II secretion system minor pseudopilin GspI [Gammaproteobacteria bacterium]|nr:type II secretion system minor pseudopilin GspI [Gammaproteobacteria bacterium]